MTGMLNIAEPSNLYESSKSSERKEAMKEEYESIIKNNTWDLVKLPNDKKPIGCRWLFKLKFKADGSIDKHKARLVAKGYSQKEGIDFEETFSPVAKLNTIRLIIALATKHHWKIHQLDVKSAFLNGDLKQEVYLVQPEGFVKKGEEHLQNNKLQVNDGSKYANATLYRQLVGSLIYLTTTRLDIAYVVSVLSQFMTRPHENHWVAAKGVLRYLQATSEFGILYSDSFDVSLAGYTNSDWAGN
eukprot:PITA_27830